MKIKEIDYNNNFVTYDTERGFLVNVYAGIGVKKDEAFIQVDLIDSNHNLKTMFLPYCAIVPIFSTGDPGIIINLFALNQHKTVKGLASFYLKYTSNNYYGEVKEEEYGCTFENRKGETEYYNFRFNKGKLYSYTK